MKAPTGGGNKSKNWVKNKYFKRYRGKDWAFICQGTDRKGKEKSFILYDISNTPIIRHVFMSATGSKLKSNQVLTTPHSKNTGKNVKSNKGNNTEPWVQNMFHVALAKTNSQRTKMEMPYLWR